MISSGRQRAWVGWTVLWVTIIGAAGPVAREADARDAVLVKVIEPVPGEVWPAAPGGYVDALGTVFVATVDQLWKTDGTAAGTVLVTQFPPNPSLRGLTFGCCLREVNGTLLFFRVLNSPFIFPRWDLWRSDGTTAGTTGVTGATGSLNPATAKVGETLLFSGGFAGAGELWKSDGTAAGTTVVKTFDSIPEGLTSLGGTLFFTASDAAAGSELWRSDGTTAGTVRVKDIDPGPAGSLPRDLTPMNGLLFFRADDGGSGMELWRSDGTTGGTTRVKDINPGPGGSGTGPLVPLAGTLFFFADDGVNGVGLWRSDGTEAGTTPVKATGSGLAPTAVGSTLFFAVGGGPLLDLWKSDGRAAGTVLVRAGVVSSGGNPPTPTPALTGLDGVLYFVGQDAVHGEEPWRSGGTEASTVLVRDITPGAAGTPLGGFGPAGGTLFFAVSNDQVWRLTRGDVIVTGAGSAPHVRVFDGETVAEQFGLFAFPPGFAGGARVAAGDLTGDGVPDVVVGAGPGGGPQVRVLHGVTGADVRSFFPYDPGFTGGVFVAVGDVNGDGRADIVTGVGPGGGPHVRVFDGVTGVVLREFFAYDAGFSGGITVAACDVDGDGKADVVTGAGPGGGPHVQVFSGAPGALLRSFFAYDPGMTAGIFVACGDVDGDGVPDIITGAGPGGGPHVQVFSGRTGAVIASFFAYDPGARVGMRVAAADLDGDGRAEILTAPGAGGGPHVKAFRRNGDGSVVETASFFAYDPGFLGGVFVAGARR